MATRQAVGRWAAVLAAALLAAPGLDSKGSEPIPKEITIQIGENVSMKLALIPAGKFMMGSPDSEKGHLLRESPQHEVTISKPFYMGATEVTQAQYEAVMGTNPSHFKGATNPVDMVSWNDATEFCKKLSEKTRQAVRLPTEAEWEYACRGGSKTAFCFGDAEEGLGDYAWYSANSGETTHPVGQKKPNAWGLYDMHGNVWEWCSDWFGEEYAAGQAADPAGPATGTLHGTSGGVVGLVIAEPPGPEKGSLRVLRGGGWFSLFPQYYRSAYRYGNLPDFRFFHFGFRVAVSVSAPGL